MTPSSRPWQRWGVIPVSCASAYMRYLPSTRQRTVSWPRYTARDSWRDTASSMSRSRRCGGKADGLLGEPLCQARSTAGSRPVCRVVSGSQQDRGAMPRCSEQVTDRPTIVLLSRLSDGAPDCMRCVGSPRQRRFVSVESPREGSMNGGCRSFARKRDWPAPQSSSSLVAVEPGGASVLTLSKSLTKAASSFTWFAEATARGDGKKTARL